MKFALAAILTCMPLQSLASEYGNRGSIFQSCLSEKTKSECSTLAPRPLPIMLQLFQWSCSDNIKYECMHQLLVENPTQPIAQFYGKWPFYRYLGMQEPASVVFSLLNLRVHYKGWSRVRNMKGYRLQWLLLFFPVFGMNAWLCSSIFHSRDTLLTERLDYFSAMLYILTTLFYGILIYVACSWKGLVRIFNIRKRIPLLSIAFIAFFLVHITYLTYFKFDYKYNMQAGITLGLFSFLIWVYWSITSGSSHASKIMRAYGLLMMGMLFEVFDFPPLFLVLDAHAVWHASTIYTTGLFYDFFLLDAQEQLSNETLDNKLS